MLHPRIFISGSIRLALLLALSSGRLLADSTQANAALDNLKTKYAPDAHLHVYDVELEKSGNDFALTGEVDSVQAKRDTLAAMAQAKIKVTDDIHVLPEAELGERAWGIASLSVASGREEPEHKAEMGTQILMGRSFRVLKQGARGMWYYVQSSDGYLSWLEKGTFVRCTRAQADAWEHSPLLIVTVFDETVRETTQPDALPVSDVVIADLVKKVGEESDFYKVEMPDGRTGYLHKKSVEDYAAWKSTRKPNGENIERTAKLFLGRPYLWGANSPKGVDCSGFAKTVFLLNGIDLRRNASQQAIEGQPVSIEDDLRHLKKGDLIFFGGRRRDSSGPPHISHVGIYLGDKLFIQSSERVQISSLDAKSPLGDEHRIRTLVSARRYLP